MNARLPRNFGLWAVAIAMLAGSSASTRSQVNPELENKIAAIMARPEYAHSRFGMEFYSLDTHKIVFALNEQQFFVPGSTTKLLSEGTAMKLLGPDFRFKTKVYAAGTVDAQGTLKGDLVLVASGDPDLSGRQQPDGTLAFKDEDHSYAPMAGAAVVPGNPLAAIDDLASQVAAHGIHRIDGSVLVDISLFPEGEHRDFAHLRQRQCDRCACLGRIRNRCSGSSHVFTRDTLCALHQQNQNGGEGRTVLTGV
jgi:D-alanyl-D-alanine carboxypeptidase/D-alanyl-D-alanine-endopeptidase (penicillin-binding protein 4)